MPHDIAITPNDVYRVPPRTLAQELHVFCKIAKEDPASVIADALALHLDELGGACHDPTIVDQAAGAP